MDYDVKGTRSFYEQFTKIVEERGGDGKRLAKGFRRHFSMLRRNPYGLGSVAAYPDSEDDRCGFFDDYDYIYTICEDEKLIKLRYIVDHQSHVIELFGYVC